MPFPPTRFTHLLDLALHVRSHRGVDGSFDFLIARPVWGLLTGQVLVLMYQSGVMRTRSRSKAVVRVL